MPLESYTIGVDVGQLSDPTAVAVVRRVEIDDESPAIYEIPYLQRLALRTPYPSVIHEIKKMLIWPELRRAEVCVDATGCGLPVADSFDAAGVSTVKVLITGGSSASVADGGIWHVSKSLLVSGLQSLLHSRRLKILKTLPEAAALEKELTNFRAEVSDVGVWRYSAASNSHDDLILAIAIAAWRAKSGETFRGWLGFYSRLAGRARGELPPPKAAPWPEPVIDSDAPAAQPKITLHAPPFQNYQPARGARYCSNEAGLIENIDPAHEAAMIKMGCWRLHEVVSHRVV